MKQLLLVIFTCFLINIPASCQAMFRVRISTATRAAKEYYYRAMQVAQKPFLAQTQKSVAKKFPAPQFKKEVKPEHKTDVLTEHTKLVSSLSASLLDVCINQTTLCSSALGLYLALDLNYERLLSLEPKAQLLYVGAIFTKGAFCYFGTKNLLKNGKELKQVYKKISSLAEEQKKEFKLYEDVH